MTKEKEEMLVKKYPKCFRDYYKSPQVTCLCWGCECGDGWFDILDRLFEKLEKLDVALHQVKEKFGGLRVYFECPAENDDVAYKLIENAEVEAANTCEVCGKQGRIKIENYWYKCRCGDCV